MSTNQGNFAGQQINNVNMPNQQVYAQWAQLSVQLSQFNAIIAIDAATFASWNHVDQQFIIQNYMMATGGTIPMFIGDGNRVFLGPLALFQRQAGFQVPAAGQYPQPVGLQQHVGAQLQRQAIAGGVQPHAVADGAQVQAIAAGVANPAARSGRAKAKANAGNPPRPRNAWILYRQHHHDAFAAAHPEIGNNQISSLIATKWHAEPKGVKDIWHRMAQEEKAEHQRKYPNYKFTPRKPSEKKRRSTNKKAATLTLQVVSTNQATPTAQGSSSASTPTVTQSGSTVTIVDPITPQYLNANTGSVQDLDLAAEAKIFYQQMLNFGYDMAHGQGYGAADFNDDAQADEGLVAEYDGQIHQNEEDAIPDFDGDNIFDRFFQFS
ncbi:hypothetical protein N431DRAFT_426929 [Stipitochalara longipes BDJ]|nr:hypothetical protein N431DRAFT_426929 [Stipitochalara longipes BDJ]